MRPLHWILLIVTAGVLGAAGWLAWRRYRETHPAGFTDAEYMADYQKYYMQDPAARNRAVPTTADIQTALYAQPDVIHHSWEGAG